MINVLIVADELHTQQALSKAVAAEGANPIGVATFEDALAELAHSQFPLIFVPLTAGSIGAVELCRLLRATRGGLSATVIALPRTEIIVPRTLALAGFDALLRAPLDSTDIAFHVQSAARRVQRDQETARIRARGEYLRRLSLDLAWSTTIEQQARHALDAALKLLPATRGALWLRDSEHHSLECVCSVNLSDSYAPRVAGMFAFMSRERWLELTRRPLVHSNLRAERGQLGDLARAEGFDTAVAIALFTPARIVGVLALLRDDGPAPSAEELSLAETVAATTAMALDQTQLRNDNANAEQTYRELVNQLPSGVFIHDAQGNFLMTNPALQTLTGYSAEEFQMLNMFDLLSGAHDGQHGRWLSAELTELGTAALARNQYAEQLRGPFQIELMRSDQRPREVELYLRALQLRGERDVVQIQGIVRDVTDANRNRRNLEMMGRVAEILTGERDLGLAARRVLRELHEHAHYPWLALWGVDRAGHPTILAEESALGQDAAAALRERATVLLGMSHGPRLLPGLDSGPPLAILPLTDDGRPIGLLGVAPRDLAAFEDTELSFVAAVGAHLAPTLVRFQLQHELEERATVDPTTGLENRAAFHHHLDDAVERSRANPVSLLIVGVDHFKQLNDVYGHAIGDELLRQVGQLISVQLSAGQRVARFTSDEFAVVAPNVSREGVFALAEQLRISIGTKLFTAAEQVEQLTVSIGLATYPDDAGNADRLVLATGHALYLAKQAGRNQVYQSNEAFAELASAHGRIDDLLRQAPKETLTLIVRAMDQRLPERAGHAQRVARVAVELGQELGLDKARLVALRIAALTHDIGMFALPDALLRKPSKLSTVERELLSSTPLVARRLLSQIELPPTVLPAVVHQHERWDGAGYPSRLAGAAIPLGARIIAVADAFDALTSDRAHRESLTTDAALEILRQSAGEQFDPDVVEAAIRLKGRLPDIEAPEHDEIGSTLHRALQLVEV